MVEVVDTDRGKNFYHSIFEWVNEKKAFQLKTLSLMFSLCSTTVLNK